MILRLHKTVFTSFSFSLSIKWKSIDIISLENILKSWYHAQAVFFITATIKSWQLCLFLQINLKSIKYIYHVMAMDGWWWWWWYSFSYIMRLTNRHQTSEFEFIHANNHVDDETRVRKKKLSIADEGVRLNDDGYLLFADLIQCK